MRADTASPEHSTAWESEIRAREEALRIAFLAANTAALDEIMADGYIVNSPLQRVLEKPQLLELLRAGRIRHSSFEVEIEQMHRHGEVVVVMGRDSVVDPPDGTLTHRRFTNIWRREAGAWRSIARHAHVVSSGLPASDA
jgi:ketosteroid isomerase-like protein